MIFRYAVVAMNALFALGRGGHGGLEEWCKRVTLRGRFGVECLQVHQATIDECGGARALREIVHWAIQIVFILVASQYDLL